MRGGGGGWGERGKLLSWSTVIVNFWCPWIVMYRKAVLWIIVIEFYVLHETLTANLIVYTVHVHWGQIQKIKSLIWLNDLNHHLEAWFNFTFEIFYVTSHFSVLRPKHVAEIKYTICFATHEMQKCCSWTCDEATFAPLDTVHTFQGQWSMLN